MPWPGKAAVYVSVFSLIKGDWRCPSLLDGVKVGHISGGLDSLQQIEVYRLKKMRGTYSQGFCLMGEGFVLNDLERRELLQVEPHAERIIFPYFTADDLTESPELTPKRWAIDFGDASYEEAQCYPKTLCRVESLVKPFREKQTGQIHQSNFWKYWDMRPRLRKARTRISRVLVMPRHAKYIFFRFADIRAIFNESVKVFLFDDYMRFALLQSSIHDVWARWRSGTRGGSIVAYSTSKSLDTFPMSHTNDSELPACAETYYSHRDSLMKTLQVGPTGIYNRFHDPQEASKDMVRLRALHQSMDALVMAAFGWDDLELGHGYHAVPYLPERDRLRYTIAEEARMELVGRLADLNREQYEAEVEQGLHSRSNNAMRMHGKRASSDRR